MLSDPVDGESLYADAYGPYLPQTPEPDKRATVKGMYPLLNLITEQGSGGLGNPVLYHNFAYAQNLQVDKIVIAQESLREFINALSPGAYSSITKVNFKILDDLVLKPFGVYGSKEEIVKFLGGIKAVDDNSYVVIFFGVWEG